MFFPVLLSFLQICFIPGFIAYMLLGRKSTDNKLLMVPVFSFGLSLIINFLVVFALTYFHIYTRSVLIILLSAECIILAGIFINKPNLEVFDLKKALSELIDEFSIMINIKESYFVIIRVLIFLVPISLFVTLILTMFLNSGKIFEEWDAVFSWNRWAVDFSNNNMPLSTYHYPQLIPANWSIAYVLCNYPLQFIPKTIMHLFLILLVYSLIVLGINQRKAFLYFSVFFVFQSLSKHRFYWTEGYADVSVAFYSILVYLSLIMINKDQSEFDKLKYIILSFLFACGAAITKQAGLFILILYPFFLYILSKGKINWNYPKILKISLLFLGLIVLTVLPYYFWAEVEINKGHAASEISYVTKDIYNGASYSERFSHAIEVFKDVFSSKIIFNLSLVFFLFSFTDKVFRLLNLFFLIPCFLIWALFFSYDIRNISIIIPYYSISIGIGLVTCFNIIQKLNVRTQISQFKKTILVSIIILVFFLSIPFVIIPYNKRLNLNRLKESQDVQLKLLGNEYVNRALSNYNEKSPITKKIVSDYAYLMIQPEINQFFEYVNIENLEPTSNIFSDESYGFLLWTSQNTDSTKFPDFIESRIKSGDYSEVFKHDGYRFIKIR